MEVSDALRRSWNRATDRSRGVVIMSDLPANPQYFADVSADEKQWAMFAHLSALVATMITGMGFLGPLIIWVIQKDKMKFVDDQGKEALNFQLTLIGAGFVLAAVGAPLALITFGIALLLVIPLAGGLVIYGIVMPIIAAMKANAGEAYRYPYTIRVIT
jgi:uncharacterized Tic20 family protein